MNLIDFVMYLDDKDLLSQYMEKNYPEIDYYDAEVYLKNTISAKTDLVIFDDQKIDGKIEMIVNNEKFVNLFTLDLLVEVYEDALKIVTKKNEAVDRIIEYRMNDA